MLLREIVDIVTSRVINLEYCNLLKILVEEHSILWPSGHGFIPMDAFEREVLREQRRARGRWKRLNVEHYIEKVRSFAASCKEKKILQDEAALKIKNSSFDQGLQDSLARKYNRSDPTNQRQTLPSSYVQIPPTQDYSASFILHAEFHYTNNIAEDEDALSKLETELHKWSEHLSSQAYIAFDRVFDYFLQLEQEYQFEIGTMSDSDIELGHTLFKNGPIKYIDPLRHPDCDPEFCSRDVPCDLLLADRTYFKEIPTLTTSFHFPQNHRHLMRL